MRRRQPQEPAVRRRRLAARAGGERAAQAEGLAADAGANEVVLGMAHRGRLNVLANILGKSYEKIFNEFEGHIDPDTVQGSGDVKYHMGTRGRHTSPAGNTIDVFMSGNPSHLEAVDPVVVGMARAKLDVLEHRDDQYPVLPVLVHGDAAFAGQGVVFETMSMSQLRGYRVGGTVHIIVNNQLGFTTAPPQRRALAGATGEEVGVAGGLRGA